MSMNCILIIFFLSYGIYAFFHNFKFWIIYVFCILIYYIIISYKLYTNKQTNISKKINYTSWTNNYDPQTYTTIKLDITKIIPYLKQNRSSFNSNYFCCQINVNYFKKISRSLWLY